MAGAQHRRAETDDRAEAGSGARTLQPHEIATAFGHIPNDLSLIAQRPDEPEAQSPSLEEPWDADAADELARLYASGDAGLAQPLSGDAELQLRLARTAAQAAALRPAPQMSGIDHVGIEARLAEMARTIETALARLGAGASGPSTPADAGGLKLIEAHAAELLAQAQETRTELGRLAAVEAQLGELKTSLSEGRIAGLIEAVMPTEDELTRFAEAAAQKAIRARREAAPDLAAAARLNERTGEIQRLLTGFIEEHRRNEHEAAEALETMQQAMQHILDRTDAIEAAQAANEVLSESLQTREQLTPPARAASAVGSVEDARIRAGLAPPAWSDLGFGDRRIGPDPFEVSAGDRGDAMAGASLAAAETADHEVRIKPFPILGAHTARAASEYADGRPPVRPGILVAASLAAFLLAGYWLVSGPRLRLPDGASTQSAEQHHPGETSPSAPPSLRSSSAIPDGDSGGAGRRAKAAGRPDQAIEHKERGGAAPETQAQRMENGTTAGGAPAEPDRWTVPARRGTLQGPVGVVIEQGPTAMSPEELLRLRQKQRMAALSTQLGQQAANSSAAQPVVVPANEAAAGQQEALRTGAVPQPRTSVELPPLMIGPHSLRHAAANGDASAQLEVAARFAEGKGVKQDFEQAATWYQRAATQGLAAAQYRLAALYERGVGVKADPARAKAWYKRAAEQGNVKAMHNLAVLSAGDGEGTTADYAAAGRWFTEAAAHGLADSQYNLGILHENGLGVGRDHAAAYKWYALAARNGDKEALRRRELVKERLSPAAIKATDVDIAAWRPLASDQIVNDARAAGQSWKGRAAGGAD